MTYKAVKKIIDTGDITTLRYRKEEINKESWRDISLFIKFTKDELREFQDYINFDDYFKWNYVTEKVKKEFADRITPEEEEEVPF